MCIVPHSSASAPVSFVCWLIPPYLTFQCPSCYSPAVSAREPVIIELEKRLAEQLGAEVDIRYGKNNKGRVIMKFEGVDQLEAIYRRFFTTDP